MPAQCDIQSAFTACFESLDPFDEQGLEYGLMVLAVSGQFIRNAESLDVFVNRLKETLPADVKIYAPDGMAIGMVPDRDEWRMVFGSKEWPRVAEGGTLPRLTPLFTHDPTGNPVWDRTIFSPMPGCGAEIRVSKRTHKMTIPKSRETSGDDGEFVIVIEPLEPNYASAI